MEEDGNLEGRRRNLVGPFKMEPSGSLLAATTNQKLPFRGFLVTVSAPAVPGSDVNREPQREETAIPNFKRMILDDAEFINNGHIAV